MLIYIHFFAKNILKRRGGGIYKHWKCVDWFKNVWLSFLQDSETFKTVYMENIAENKTKIEFWICKKKIDNHKKLKGG